MVTNTNYNRVEYKGSAEYVEIICLTHGVFLQRPGNHLNGHGCQQCGILQNKYNPRISNEKFIEQCENIRGTENFDYSRVQYDGTYNLVEIICKKHGRFYISANYFLKGGNCPHCKAERRTSWRKTGPEKKLLEHYGDIFQQFVWTVLKNKELDLYSEKHKLTIKVDGLYWHSKEFKDKYYHLDKTERCEKLGIRLLHFTDAEINNDFEYVCNIIDFYLSNNYKDLKSIFKLPYNRRYVSTLLFTEYKTTEPVLENNMWNCGYIIDTQ